MMSISTPYQNRYNDKNFITFHYRGFDERYPYSFQSSVGRISLRKIAV